MAMDTPTALVAVDIGNTKIHLGVFRGVGAGMPRPLPTLQLHARDDALDPIEAWAGNHAADCSNWVFTSVNAPGAQRVATFLAQKLPHVALQQITFVDAPISIEVDFPERVGIDRIMAAVAVNTLREPRRAAIVICAGTAITVNLVSASGAFQGGAILPGMAMASQILERYTDKLPWIDTNFLHGPPAVGRNTQAALASGIYWGTVGALTKIVERIAATTGGEPQVFIAGGDAPRLATQLPTARHVPDLVLSGIAITAGRIGARTAGEAAS